MSVEGVDFGSVALSAAARDLTAPLVLLRQLSFQLDSQLGGEAQPAASRTLEQMRVVIGQTFGVAEQLRTAIVGADNLVLEPVQLVGLCREVADNLQPLSSELKCELDFELPRRQSVVVVGNYHALKTLLAGFLTDAMHYGERHTVEDRSAGRGRINDRMVRDERIVRVRVSTNRSGVASIAIHDDGPELNLTRALTMLQRPDSVAPATSRPLMSSLNLLLADQLMRAMHGQLSVHNHRRGGVTIEAGLPISQQLSLLEAV